MCGGFFFFFFLCRWPETLKEAKHENGYKQDDRHVLNICTLNKVEYDNSWCRELWQLNRGQDFTCGGVILINPM